jgi:hypothetical protein
MAEFYSGFLASALETTQGLLTRAALPRRRGAAPEDGAGAQGAVTGA